MKLSKKNLAIIILIAFSLFVLFGTIGFFAYQYFVVGKNVETKISTDAWLPESVHVWPGFHGNYNHTGYTNVTGPGKSNLKWKLYIGKVEGNSPNSVAIAKDGTVYVAGGGKVMALSEEGKEIWSKPYKNPQGPSISRNGDLYFVISDSIVALDKNGNEKWRHKTGGNTIFGPTVGPDGTIYQGSWDKYFYAINPDGTLKWKYKTAGSVSYPASVGKDGTIYLGGGDAHSGPDGNLYAFNPNGTLKWKYDTKMLRIGSPAIGSDGLIYAPASPSLFVFDSSGDLKWKLGSTKQSFGWANTAYAASECGPPPLPPCGNGQAGGQSQSQPQNPNQNQNQSQPNKNEIAGIITPAIAANGMVYIGSAQGVLSAIDPLTHNVAWTYKTSEDPKQKGFYGLPSFPLVDSNNTVYAGSVDGKMYAIDKNGQLLWEYQTGGRITEASPAMSADGSLYFTSEDGYLYAMGD